MASWRTVGAFTEGDGLRAALELEHPTLAPWAVEPWLVQEVRTARAATAGVEWLDGIVSAVAAAAATEWPKVPYTVTVTAGGVTVARGWDRGVE